MDIRRKKKLLKKASFFLIILVLFLSIYFIFINPPGESSHEVPNSLLLIVIDTLRADHLGCYGYEKAEPGNIDKIAKSGILFEQAICPIPETGPSVSSLLTSLLPINHGVRRNTNPLSGKVETLAEILKKKGFETAAFTDSFPFRRLQILQGFDFFRKRVLPLSLKKNITQEAMKDSLAWLRKNRNKKSFTFIHFYDPHMPYKPRIQSKRTESLGYDGPYTGGFGPVFELWYKKRSINEKDIEYMTSAYDDEIRFVDKCIGLIIQELKRIGSDKKTLIVLTADHGESLGEHKYYFDHGDYLFEDQIRVPLIIKYPGMPNSGKIIKAQVRTIDIMPTVLQLLNIDYKGKLDGVSLVPLLYGRKRLLATRYAFSESDSIDFGNPNCRGYIKGIRGKHMSVRHGGMKLIYVPLQSGEKYELYDLNEDPLELSNIIEKEPERGREMKEALFEWMSKRRKLPGKKEKIDKEALRILKSLHYVHK